MEIYKIIKQFSFGGFSFISSNERIIICDKCIVVLTDKDHAFEMAYSEELYKQIKKTVNQSVQDKNIIQPHSVALSNIFIKEKK